MKTQKQIEEKFEELNQRMRDLPFWDCFGLASTDGQRFILEWVMEDE